MSLRLKLKHFKLGIAGRMKNCRVSVKEYVDSKACTKDCGIPKVSCFSRSRQIAVVKSYNALILTQSLVCPHVRSS